MDSTWLRCPNCFRPLAAIDERVLGCDEGHRFDRSRHDTVTLLPPRAPHTMGDSRVMLDARNALLDTGLYRPIADAIVRASAVVAGTDAGSPLHIADLGCGTGYYAGALADQYPTGVFLLADRSPTAVRMATRVVQRSTGVVLDLWRPLPLRDGVADLAINVFAPRNPAEFARVIRPRGGLVVVVPTAAHLHELRAGGDLLDVPGGKDAHVTAQVVAAGFSPVAAERVEYQAAVDATQRAALVGMGPSAHHARSIMAGELTPSESRAAEPDVLSITVSVDVLTFRRGPDV